jgi:hypothetical protein
MGIFIAKGPTFLAYCRQTKLFFRLSMSLEVYMHWRLSLAATFSSSLIFLSVITCLPSALAQGGPDIFVTPIPNAPFSAVVEVERTGIRPDGSSFNFKSIRQIGRDLHGRIHNELRIGVPVSSTDTPTVIRVHLFDPQTRTNTWFDPNVRVFWSQNSNQAPATAPPAPRFASSGTLGLPQNDFTKQEDLGIHEMDGVSVHGIRESQTIAAESSGTGKEVTITDEYWYSEELRINLLIKHSDPRTGTTTLKVTQVSRTEPDAAFFQVPEGYKPRSTQTP